MLENSPPRPPPPSQNANAAVEDGVDVLDENDGVTSSDDDANANDERAADADAAVDNTIHIAATVERLHRRCHCGGIIGREGDYHGRMMLLLWQRMNAIKMQRMS